MSGKSKYRFFIDKGKTVMFASTDTGGYGISVSSNPVRARYDKTNTIKALLDIHYYYSEIKQNDLKRYFTPDAIKQINKELKISVEKIQITEEQKNDIIQILKFSRAFNQDSAMIMDDKEDLCYQLADEGILKLEGNKFYVQNV